MAAVAGTSRPAYPTRDVATENALRPIDFSDTSREARTCKRCCASCNVVLRDPTFRVVNSWMDTLKG